MSYKVVPFVANISSGEGAGAAAKQLVDIINQHAAEGWIYQRMENVEINIHDEGNKGCFGYGATPPTQSTTRFDMVVFLKG
jgi:hypothetical protein